MAWVLNNPEPREIQHIHLTCLSRNAYGCTCPTFPHTPSHVNRRMPMSERTLKRWVSCQAPDRHCCIGTSTPHFVFRHPLLQYASARTHQELHQAESALSRHPTVNHACEALLTCTPIAHNHHSAELAALPHALQCISKHALQCISKSVHCHDQPCDRKHCSASCQANNG